MTTRGPELDSQPGSTAHTRHLRSGRFQAWLALRASRSLLGPNAHVRKKKKTESPCDATWLALRSARHATSRQQGWPREGLCPARREYVKVHGRANRYPRSVFNVAADSTSQLEPLLAPLSRPRLLGNQGRAKKLRLDQAHVAPTGPPGDTLVCVWVGVWIRVKDREAASS